MSARDRKDRMHAMSSRTHGAGWDMDPSEEAAQRREALEANGICLECQDAKAAPGTLVCVECGADDEAPQPSDMLADYITHVLNGKEPVL